jgi:putative membrane protein
MKKLIVRWAVNVLALWVTGELVSSISFSNTTALIVVGFVLTILNGTLKPVLKFLSFPISFLTLGLFSLVINGAVLYLAFSFVEGSSIGGLLPAVIASVIVSVINHFLSGVFD